MSHTTIKNSVEKSVEISTKLLNSPSGIGAPLKFELHVENGSLTLYSVTSVDGISWQRFGLRTGSQ